MSDLTDLSAVGERLCTRGLRWLDTQRHRATLPPAVPAELVDVDTFKSLAEIGMAARIVIREGVTGTVAGQAAARLLDHTWQQFGAGDVLLRLQRLNPTATHAMETYAHFAAAGHRHPGLHALCTHLTTLRAYRVPELIPNRQLGLVGAARRLGLPAHHDPGALIDRTLLGGQPEPWTLTTHHAYSLTHAVFHLTDHGADPDAIPDNLQRYLRQWLPVWLEVYAESGYWDLLGELLIVDACLSTPIWYRSAWERFAAAQHTDGMMPNGVTVPTEDAVHTFRNHYHSTVVAVIAGALACSRNLDQLVETGAGHRARR